VRYLRLSRPARRSWCSTGKAALGETSFGNAGEISLGAQLGSPARTGRQRLRP
jgi:hypothetical protein